MFSQTQSERLVRLKTRSSSAGQSVSGWPYCYTTTRVAYGASPNSKRQKECWQECTAIEVLGVSRRLEVRKQGRIVARGPSAPRGHNTQVPTKIMPTAMTTNPSPNRTHAHVLAVHPGLAICMNRLCGTGGTPWCGAARSAQVQNEACGAHNCKVRGMVACAEEGCSLAT
jgi:hypothetical protein